MKIGEYEILVVSYPNEEELVAEFGRNGFGIGSVHIENGKALINLGPNRRNEHGVWTIDYNTFKQIIAALDYFLVSIGYPLEEQKDDEA